MPFVILDKAIRYTAQPGVNADFNSPFVQKNFRYLLNETDYLIKLGTRSFSPQLCQDRSPLLKKGYWIMVKLWIGRQLFVCK